jgi:hypothetical protein
MFLPGSENGTDNVDNHELGNTFGDALGGLGHPSHCGNQDRVCQLRGR